MTTLLSQPANPLKIRGVVSPLHHVGSKDWRPCCLHDEGGVRVAVICAGREK